jgi:hypothetical protein
MVRRQAVQRYTALPVQRTRLRGPRSSRRAACSCPVKIDCKRCRPAPCRQHDHKQLGLTLPKADVATPETGRFERRHRAHRAAGGINPSPERAYRFAAGTAGSYSPALSSAASGTEPGAQGPLTERRAGRDPPR